MKLIMATGNQNKVREIREMLEGSSIEILSLKDAGITADIEENGATFEENAIIKAEAIRDLCGQMVLADDSGLMIDAMDGGPGVHSARFMGEDTSYDIKNAAILRELADVPEEKRGARFVCAMALAYPEKDGIQPETKVFRGVFEGRIAFEAKGENGFGYDPIFYVPSRNMTSAELSPEEKNAMSHRGNALRQVVAELRGKSD
ncbi:MAG: XTP/dITP diphosphatase [Lachnospiraceae bacterium]|nr:XTP/dITP diphosphatase [Lachnospiraceae bacterium]